MAIILTSICFGVLVYNTIGIKGWDGMGLAFVMIPVLLGIWIDVIIGVIIKKRVI